MTTATTGDVDLDYGDALSRPYWEGAAQHRLLVQRCSACGRSHLYPRSLCASCWSDDLTWQESTGEGVVFSQSTVQISIAPEFEPPYTVAVVELDEGARLLTNIVNGETQIGGRVRVTWRDREGLPPLPVFEPVEAAG